MKQKAPPKKQTKTMNLVLCWSTPPGQRPALVRDRHTGAN